MLQTFADFSYGVFAGSLATAAAACNSFGLEQARCTSTVVFVMPCLGSHVSFSSLDVIVFNLVGVYKEGGNPLTLRTTISMSEVYLRHPMRKFCKESRTTTII